MTKRAAFSFAKRTGSAACLVFALLFPVLFLASLSLAQGPDTLWTRLYAEAGEQAVVAVEQTRDGGYMIAGNAADSIGGQADFYLIKANESGDILWTQRYGGDSDDIMFSAQQTSDGGYIMAGYTHSFGVPIRGSYLAKVNGEGDTLWTRLYCYPEEQAMHVVRQTSDGGYVLAGYIVRIAGFDYYLIKTNAAGDTMWTRRYGQGWLTRSEAWEVMQTNEGGYLIVGTTFHIGNFARDVFIVRANENGDTLWTRVYQSESDDVVSCVCRSADGGYMLAGCKIGEEDDYDIYIMKANSTGDLEWTTQIDYGEPFFGANDGALSIVPMPAGGYVLGAEVNCYGGGCVPPLEWGILMYLNDAGDSVWTRRYGDPYPFSLAAVCQTEDEGFLLAGDVLHGPELPSSDIYIAKTESVTSISEQVRPTVCETVILFPNYPNPFNVYTQIAFDLPIAGPVTLKVHDLLGREVATLVDGLNAPGHHSVLFDGSNLPSGIYLYRLEMGIVHEAKKMVLLK